jgi:hypothetical protein
MSPTNPPARQQPDFSNFRWVPGARVGDSVCVSIDPQGAIRLGIKGYDKKHAAPGYIAAHLSVDGLQALHALVGAALSAARAASYTEAIAAIQAA